MAREAKKGTIADSAELVDSGNLDQLVQQEVLIAGFHDVLNNGNAPLPFCVLTQTTFAPDDQSWMNSRFEAFDQVSYSSS
jgi:hypothetical protein